MTEKDSSERAWAVNTLACSSPDPCLGTWNLQHQSKQFLALETMKDPGAGLGGVCVCGELIRHGNQEGDTWKNGCVGGCPQLWLEVRKGSLGSRQHARPSHTFLLSQKRLHGWAGLFWASMGAYLRLHQVAYCKSSPRDAGEETLWVSTAPFLGFSRGR